jgi:alpha/beta superfamily hydrolase
MDWNETCAELARAWAEKPVIMPGPHGDLYGIFTPPAPKVAPAGLCVILFGRNRWWGDRLSVKSARWLAARGFACLRFDYHGYGESEGESQNIDGEKLYSEDATAVIRYMRQEFGQSRFVLSGFCFDGRTALSAIEEEGDVIEAVVCISPEVTGAPGELLAHLFTVDKARNFFRFPAFYKKRAIARALRRSINLIKIARPTNSGEGLAERQLSVKFRHDFQALIRSKARCFFLHGRDDPEYHGFQLVERSLFPKLNEEQRARITVEVWPGKIHLLDDPALQRKVTERTLSWIDGCREQTFTLLRPACSVTVPEDINGFCGETQDLRILETASPSEESAFRPTK